MRHNWQTTSPARRCRSALSDTLNSQSRTNNDSVCKYVICQICKRNSNCCYTQKFTHHFLLIHLHLCVDFFRKCKTLIIHESWDSWDCFVSQLKGGWGGSDPRPQQHNSRDKEEKPFTWSTQCQRCGHTCHSKASFGPQLMPFFRSSMHHC